MPHRPVTLPAKPAPINGILFDFDGVLTTDPTGTHSTCRHLGHALGMAPERVRAALRPHNIDLTLGRKTHAQVWPAVCHSLGVAVDPNLLLAAFDSTPMNQSMLTLARSLLPRVKLGIVTDNKLDRMDRLRALHHLDAVFDPIVVSSEVGSSKSDAAIFEVALRRFNLRADECVFIDNDPANLIAPRSLGMRTIFHDDQRNDVDAVARYLAGQPYPV